MKRKLDRNDVPSPGASEPVEAPNSTFESLNLDNRLLQAISKEKYVNPTPVQAKAIPLALEGKDILARARTGSGKTAVYVLSVLQSLLSSKSVREIPFQSSRIVLTICRTHI